MRKTKIVATLGPSTDNPDVMRDLIISGLDVARINFSHGEYDEHLSRINLLRNTAAELGATVALLADTKGPEVRLGKFKDGFAMLETGSIFTLTGNDMLGDLSGSCISYKNMFSKVKTGDSILLDDGLIKLQVETVTTERVITKVINGGKISDRKSVNVPGVSLDMPYISDKDHADIKFIVSNNFDFIAASFVRDDDDVVLLRNELDKADKNNKIKIIAKIENAEGVRNIDAIAAACDGLMVARGDLGVEVEFEELPIIQKDLIKRVTSQGKPVITATQMLESMIVNPRPTRAETSDVANAIYDGTSAIMLSGETAIGKYPAQAIRVMDKIARKNEAAIDYISLFSRRRHLHEASVTNAISNATVSVAHDLDAAAILTVSFSGNTAQNISKFRPSCPIIACTPDPIAFRQLKLNWGIIPVLTTEETEINNLFTHAVDAAMKSGHISRGDLIVVTSGVPIGLSGTTNLLKVHIAGEKVMV